MIDMGFIRESKSSWCNKIRPVDKPDGSIRICADLMALNITTEKEEEEMPWNRKYTGESSRKQVSFSDWSRRWILSN